MYHSEVLDELIKTAAEKILKEQEEEDLIEKAHPEPVYVANARGDGGLVENQHEMHQKFMEAMNRFPSGTFVGVYAKLIDRLIKNAEECENLGQKNAAKILDKTASNLVAELEAFLAKAPSRG